MARKNPARKKRASTSAGKRTSPAKGGFPVVGIGASAGGLEAMEDFFDHLPPDTGMAFIVVTHLHPGHTSLLPGLRRLLEGILPKNEALEDYEVQAEFPKIGRRTFMLNGRRLTQDKGLPDMILLALEDVTSP